MNTPIVLLTPRLRIRPWTEADFAPFAAMNADPRVMEYFPAPLSRGESDKQARHVMDHFARCGFGTGIVETRETHEFVGMVGLWRADYMPAVEIGWRLAHEHWGRGFATEAAREVLRFGFEDLQLPEIISYTVPHNLRSRAVMEKLGLIYDPSADFDHPKLPANSPLRRHVLYRMAADDFASRTSQK